MVFSLFKKKAQKMPEREVMRPKPAFAPPPAVAGAAGNAGRGSQGP